MPKQHFSEYMDLVPKARRFPGEPALRGLRTFYSCRSLLLVIMEPEIRLRLLSLQGWPICDWMRVYRVPPFLLDLKPFYLVALPLHLRHCRLRYLLEFHRGLYLDCRPEISICFYFRDSSGSGCPIEERLLCRRPEGAVTALSVAGHTNRFHFGFEGQGARLGSLVNHPAARRVLSSYALSLAYQQASQVIMAIGSVTENAAVKACAGCGLSS